MSHRPSVTVPVHANKIRPELARAMGRVQRREPATVRVGRAVQMVRRLVPVRRIVLVILIPAGLIRDALIPAGLTVARRIAVVIAVIAATI